MKTPAPTPLSLFVLLAVSTALPAQAYQLRSPTFSGAAVNSSGASFAALGTVGEAGVVGQAAGGGYAVTLGFWSGVAGPAVAVDVDPSFAPTLELALRAGPNPFHRATEIRFNQPRPGVVQMRVYDIAGRLVRTMHAGALPAGPQALRWDGTSNAGGRVSSGQYFARVLLDGDLLGHTVKISLIK